MAFLLLLKKSLEAGLTSEPEPALCPLERENEELASRLELLRFRDALQNKVIENLKAQLALARATINDKVAEVVYLRRIMGG